MPPARVTKAVKEAQAILARYVEHGPPATARKPSTSCWPSLMTKIWSRPWRRKMRKAWDELDEEGRNALL